ncbi:hypothetical protein QWZ16_24145 [Vibrio ostreicida]|uniref:Uncharacterized protein n=1 Tax=Vibrio ostreicida TaxID=526588 RepID=A0ABT8C351_9VIBR|nr:hypothetical protein [Vibrio ostreicida]MDN3612650.1 hypothetical protein [Vibrio ostreicida]MDN3612677.1 hypothetical protein [Vibrio ostreicida]
MQYFLVIATLSIMIAISSYTQSQSGNIHFSGTRWVCAEEKSGFIRKSYDQYQRITQTHTLFFTSDTMVSQYYSGTLIHKMGWRRILNSSTRHRTKHTVKPLRSM